MTEAKRPAKRPNPQAAGLMVTAIAFIVLGGVGLALAHHGFAGRYHLSRPVWIEGMVVEAFFGPPHAEITLNLPADLVLPAFPPDLDTAAAFLDSASLMTPPVEYGRRVTLELPPTSQYSSLEARVKAGDRIAAVALRNCEAPHQLNVQWLRLPGGEIVARAAPMSYMVPSC